ncbi:hypothetical protein J437_LFUL018171 [Ladona fulva]|uniref:Tumor suppressor candidate 2 n=1 Tax=Ladona fulva TaxID=123851 RepID=A0A8K0P8Z4_LADFU|nr:hypothetical protein J437_LFUL018171 [Ladona fulva]
MGNSGSKFVKKIVSPLTTFSESKPEHANLDILKSGTPYVLSRKGSMYMDEDGDLAHEFYVEDPPQKKGTKATMKRVFSNLTPQGEVAYPFPRLHVDFPVILHQA